MCFLFFFVDDDPDQPHFFFLGRDKQTGQQHSSDYALLCVGFVLASFLLGLTLCVLLFFFVGDDSDQLLFQLLFTPPALRSAEAPYGELNI